MLGDRVSGTAGAVLRKTGNSLPRLVDGISRPMDAVRAVLIARGTTARTVPRLPSGAEGS